MTEDYKKEVRRRKRTGEAIDEIKIEVKGAELPVWSDLWIFQVFLIPRGIYRWIAHRQQRLEQLAKQEAEFLEFKNSMTPKEFKRYCIKQWKKANR